MYIERSSLVNMQTGRGILSVAGPVIQSSTSLDGCWRAGAFIKAGLITLTR